MSSDDRLRRATGDFSAGDLDRHEAEAFRALLAEDPSLERECAFWCRVRATLGACSRERDPAAPGAHFAAALLQRAAREGGADRPRLRRLPRWAIASGAAIAAAAVVAVLLRPRPPAARMYLEDGTAVVPQSVAWDDYMPQALVSRVDPATTTVVHHHQRPWLGMWTRPVILVADGQDCPCHLVLRVAGGSPAHSIDLRPGDVVRSLDGARVTTARCIANTLARCHPGDALRVEWTRPGTGEHFVRDLRVDAAYE